MASSNAGRHRLTGRRLVVKGPDDRVLLTDASGEPTPHYQIELTGIANANSQYPMRAVVQEHCSLGCWHDVSTQDLVYWGTD